MTKVSIIIPVYNTKPEFIDESINSVLEQTHNDYEIIIIDDGSKDSKTIEYLKKVSHPNIKLIFSEHVGVGAIRDIGIRSASGEYILPLDSDDKIHPEYLEQAANILDRNSNVGIVYCNAKHFGNREDSFCARDFDKENMLYDNYIFVTSLFRKEDYLSVGGFKSDMIYGLEDWDLWLSIIEFGREVYKLPQTFFFYRKHDFSTIETMLNDDYKNRYSRLKIFMHHINLYKDFNKLYEFLYPSQTYIINENKKTFLQKIFSIKNHNDKKHKVITILGIKIKILRKKRDAK